MASASRRRVRHQPGAADMGGDISKFMPNRTLGPGTASKVLGPWVLRFDAFACRNRAAARGRRDRAIDPVRRL